MTSATLSPIATRFAWKEYRALRSFWLASFVIAAILQALWVTLAPPHSNLPLEVFAIALAAAALYAVGVAATTFSMEHEEETYGYLTGLPTRWFPLFAGKLSFAATSSLALACTLTASGWTLAGYRLPSQDGALLTLGVLGFAIVEMLGWGMFFSLLLRQPLLAALLTIGAESLALTVAVNYFSSFNLPALTLSSYFQILPARLAIAACVFAIDVLLARRWLTNESPRAAASPNGIDDEPTITSRLHQLARSVARPLSFVARRVEPRVFSHLLWQAWRQSWKPMLVMCVIVPLVCFATPLIVGAGRWDAELRCVQFSPSPFLIMFGATALYWSVVFHPDQRAQKYRFLAEHAAWPRYVWLARLAVWSLPVFIALAIAVVFLAYGVFDVNDEWRRLFGQYRRSNDWWDAQFLSERWGEANAIVRGLIYGFWGGLVGAALGQACSMFFRRALVAGFAALVLALPLLVWGAAIWAWELAPVVFLLPVALGLIAATWLRAPDWLVDRNSFTAWLKVTVAFALPIAFIAWLLPAAREVPKDISREAIWQISDALGEQQMMEFVGQFDATQIVSKWLSRNQAAATEEQQATADRLVRLGESIEYPRSRKSKGLGTGAEMGMGGEMGASPYDAEDYARRKVELNQSIVREATKLSRNDYRLSVSDASWDRVDNLAYLLSDAGRVATIDGELDAALDYYLAALTLCERLWSGQSTGTSLPMSLRQQFQERLVEWASAPEHTTERIKRAIDELDAVYPPVDEMRPVSLPISTVPHWSPPPQILATYESLRDVLTGKEPSGLLGEDKPLANYATVMSNDLPFERERALTTLDLLTINEVALWRGAIWLANQQVLQDWVSGAVSTGGGGEIKNSGDLLRKRMRLAVSLSLGRSHDGFQLRDPTDSNRPPYSWLRTSLLLRSELERRRSFADWLAAQIDTQVSAWGLRQQLALAAYRLDHGEYPNSLDQLAPDYLPFVPIDPYSGRPFEYRSDGLPHELRQYGSSQRIDPHTPLLWSVGADDGRLQKRFESYEDDTEADSLKGPTVLHDYYVFESQLHWRSSQPLVFPLPK